MKKFNWSKYIKSRDDLKQNWNGCVRAFIHYYVFRRFDVILLIISLLIRKSDKFDFVILSLQRSGSTLLVDLLNNHDQISCHSELFNDMETFNVRDNLKVILGLPQNIKIFLFRKIASLIRDKNTILGCKIQNGSLFTEKRRQLSGNLKKYVLRDDELKILLLRRSDNLRRYISYKVALKTRKWHVHKKNTILTTINFDFDEFLEFDVASKEAFRNFKENLLHAQRLLEIDYDDLCGTRRDKTLRMIQEFLGVDIQKLSSNLKKMNDFAIKDMITNYDDVKDDIAQWEKTNNSL